MTNLQIIESLCALLEEETRLIRNLSSQLMQVSALTEADKTAIAEIERKIAALTD